MWGFGGSSHEQFTSKDWRSLGLAKCPDTGDNGVHASASPFEALAERANWLGVPISEDSYGRALLAAGVPLATIEHWCADPPVSFEGKTQSLFDLLEDLDAQACLQKIVAIASIQENLMSPSRPASRSTLEKRLASLEVAVAFKAHTAFVFVKPHAVNENVTALVKQHLAAQGISILSEGTIPAEEIDQHHLIDTHYGAIASKAVKQKPTELTVQPKAQEDHPPLRAC